MDQPTSSRDRASLPPLLVAGATFVVLAIVAIALAGLGSRWGWWSFRTGFTMLRWSGYAALGAALLTVIGALAVRPPARWRALALAGVLAVVAVGTVYVPWSWRRTAREVPPIHDITTDTNDPPLFVTLLDARTGATNAVEYGGAEIATQQQAAYPDIQPVLLAVPPPRAVERAAAVARELGWEVVAVDSAAGRVEATDRTRWFGFYDDVVIRVRPDAGGSRVDVRSLSRVGGSDVGTNAQRIRTFVEQLRDADG